MNPIIVINLKTYSAGKEVLRLVKVIESFDKKIIVGAQAVDIFNLSKNTKLEVYSQHVDFCTKGRNTGYILPSSVKENGGKGVFLNHSEHKLDFNTIKNTTKLCKSLKLKVMIFAGSLSEAKKLDKLNPDYLIYEPPELVAGKRSVAEAKADLILKISKVLKSKFLVGAGIKSKEDVEVCLKQGAKGVALSSAITTAKNPKVKLKEIFS